MARRPQHNGRTPILSGALRAIWGLVSRVVRFVARLLWAVVRAHPWLASCSAAIAVAIADAQTGAALLSLWVAALGLATMMGAFRK